MRCCTWLLSVLSLKCVACAIRLLPHPWARSLIRVYQFLGASVGDVGGFFGTASLARVDLAESLHLQQQILPVHPYAFEPSGAVAGSGFAVEL